MPFLILIALAFGVAAQQGMLYVTAKDWIDACWAKAQGGKAASRQQDALWEACEPVASRAMFEGAGLLFAGGGAGEGPQRLAAVCPSSWTDLYVSGNYVLGVKLLQADGGMNVVQGVLPADVVLQRAFSSRWPRCRAEADQQGYPKVVEKAPGKFGWERPCPAHLPCSKD
jgi:hypothetical protein